MEESPISPLAPSRSIGNESGVVSYEAPTARTVPVVPEELNLRQTWFILKHRWRLVLAISCGDRKSVV